MDANKKSRADSRDNGARKRLGQLGKKAKSLTCLAREWGSTLGEDRRLIRLTWAHC